MLLLFGVSYILLQATTLSTAKVNLINNGYSTVVVAIHDDVPEDASLVEAIRREFTSASNYLYTATKYRAYFKDIIILVPQTWRNPNDYDLAVTETFSSADIVIEPDNVDRAYVLRPIGCGKTAGQMHITPRRIKGQASPSSPPSRMLVHEWGHLRWGLGDEYPYADRGQAQAYVTSDGTVAATACSVRLATTASVVDSEGRPCSPANVRSCYGRQVPANSKASIMFAQFISSVDSFCTSSGDDGVRHNVEAPNNQNRFCQYRSTWDVIMSHSDFSGGANPPGFASRNTAPNVKVVQRQDSGIFVMVLDTSGSMKGDNIVQLRQAARRFINSATEGSKLGIVTFNSVASVRLNLLTVKTILDRQRLINSLPRIDEPKGGTSIGAGLKRGLEVLAGKTVLSVQSVADAGGNIILVTDGEENATPTISAVYPYLISAKVKVNAIGIGAEASSRLSQLASDTEGTSFFANSADAGLSGAALLYESLLTIIDSGRASSAAAIVQVLSTSVDLPPGSLTRASFTIDSGLGVNTTVISFAWSAQVSDNKIPQITVTSPSSMFLNNSDATYTSEFMSLDFQLPGTAEVGEWTYTVSNPNTSTSSQSVTTAVTSRLSSSNAIILKAQLSDSDIQFPATAIISAELKMGDKFVARANVTASVSRPNSSPVTIILHDNGVGQDEFADDGLYTSSFAQYVGDGRYNVIVKATADTNQARAVDNPISNVDILNDQSISVDNTNDQIANSEPLEAFMRSTAAGFLSLSGYTSRDLMAPARVTDLTATSTNFSTFSVTLRWTAPGDDDYTGNATFCSLRLATSFYDLINMSRFTQQTDVSRSNVLSGSLNPLPGSSTQEVTVKIVNGVTDKQYYAAMTCTDEVDNQSEVSNIARFSVANPPASGSGRSTSGVKLLMLTVSFVITITFM